MVARRATLQDLPDCSETRDVGLSCRETDPRPLDVHHEVVVVFAGVHASRGVFRLKLFVPLCRPCGTIFDFHRGRGIGTRL
jgi:hypothetical protein